MCTGILLLFFLFLRTCHWCEVVFVLHSWWLGTSLSGTVQVIYSGQLAGGGTRLRLFFFPFWLSVFISHQDHSVWGRTGGEEEKLKGKRECNKRGKLKSPGNCMQHSACWRSRFSAWRAWEPSSLLLQPSVPLQQTTGAHRSLQRLMAWVGSLRLSRLLASCMPALATPAESQVPSDLGGWRLSGQCGEELGM